MASTPRDANGIPTILGTLDTDGKSVISIHVNPNHKLKIAIGTTGTSFVYTTSQRDDNRVHALWGVSSADGVTPIYIATDSNGNLLAQTI